MEEPVLYTREASGFEPVNVIPLPPLISAGLERHRPTGYASETAGLLSANRNMLFAILALCFFLSVSLYVNYLDRVSWRNLKVNYVGVQKDGSLVTVDASMFNFPLNDATLRSALINFTRRHMERIRDRVAEDYAFSLQFMNQPLQARLGRAEQMNIKAVKEGIADEVRVKFLSVSLRNVQSGCEKADCGASLIVKKTMFRGGVQKESESTVELSFVLRPKEVTDEKMKAGNPMGLVITDFGEYPHFQSDDTPREAASN